MLERAQGPTLLDCKYADTCFAVALGSVLAGCYTQVPHRCTVYQHIQQKHITAIVPYVSQARLWYLVLDQFNAKCCRKKAMPNKVFSQEDRSQSSQFHHYHLSGSFFFWYYSVLDLILQKHGSSPMSPSGSFVIAGIPVPVSLTSQVSGTFRRFSISKSTLSSLVIFEISQCYVVSLISRSPQRGSVLDTAVLMVCTPYVSVSHSSQAHFWKDRYDLLQYSRLQ